MSQNVQFGISKFPGIWTLALSDIVPLKVSLEVPNWYIHFLIETKKSESDKMCKIEVVVITYKNITYYNTSGLK